METWLVLAIFSLFLGGFFNFGMKVISKRNYNTSFVSMIGYVSATIVSGLSYFSMHQGFQIMDGLLLLLILAGADRLFFFFSTLSRVESLRNIDTTIFFPLYKTLFPIIMTIVSYLLLKENLTVKEFIGIIIGVTVPLLLITKTENGIQKNLKKGLFFVVLTSIFAAIATFFTKLVSVTGSNIDLFLFISFIFGILVSSFSYRFSNIETRKTYSKKGIYIFGAILGIIQFLGFYTFAHALQGNLAVVVTINSFSILIPIILSVIFYKEEMTLKKALVVGLSIVSIILFI